MKKVLSVVLAILLAMSILPMAYAASTSTGTCGENVTWTLDNLTGVITISGTGAMTNYTKEYYSSNLYYTSAPWGSASPRITSVIIEEGVTTVGDYAFYNCDDLTSVTLPDSLISIGFCSFYDCATLSSAQIPGNVTAIKKSAFAYCPKLSNVVIPNSVTSIGQYAFLDCHSITSIVIPDSVTAMGAYAFKNCDGLTEVIIGNGLDAIPSEAYYDCNNLNTVTLGKNVKRIYNDAFRYCPSLESITFLSTLSIIDARAFYNCNKLSTVYYAGAEARWKNISVAENNEKLTSAKVHFNYGTRITKQPSCTETGIKTHACSCCGVLQEEILPILPHSYSNGACSLCGEKQSLESAHPYENGTDDTLVIYEEGAKSISITFSAETFVEEGFDFIYIYDKNDNLIGEYTGDALASQTITVEGDTVKVRLVTDFIAPYYGYAIEKVESIKDESGIAINYWKEQIRFNKINGEYTGSFDYRTIVEFSNFETIFDDISDATDLSDGDGILEIGFLFNKDASIDRNAAIEQIKANLNSATATNKTTYSQVNNSYISTSFGADEGKNYTMACFIHNIPDADASTKLSTLAYMVYMQDGVEKYAFYEQTNTFEELYNKYYPLAFPTI